MATSGEAGAIPVSSSYPDGGLAQFVNALRAVDENSPDAALNATSIAGGKYGDRILL